MMMKMLTTMLDETYECLEGEYGEQKYVNKEKWEIYYRFILVQF